MIAAPVDLDDFPMPVCQGELEAREGVPPQG